MGAYMRVYVDRHTYTMPVRRAHHARRHGRVRPRQRVSARLQAYMHKCMYMHIRTYACPCMRKHASAIGTTAHSQVHSRCERSEAAHGCKRPTKHVQHRPAVGRGAHVCHPHSRGPQGPRLPLISSAAGRSAHACARNTSGEHASAGANGLSGALARAHKSTCTHVHACVQMCMYVCISTRTRSSTRSTPRTPARACASGAARERAPADQHAHVHASVHARAHVPQHTCMQQCEAHAMRASAGVRGLGGTRARACSYPTCPCACMRTFACTCALGGRVGQKVCDRGPAATVAHKLAARCLPAKTSRCVIYAHRVNISCCC